MSIIGEEEEELKYNQTVGKMMILNKMKKSRK
jgi:hypothetical protein